MRLLTLFFLTGCIETGLNGPKGEDAVGVDSAAGDTSLATDTATDTSTDTSTDASTDTGAESAADTAADTSLDSTADTAGDTALDTSVDTAPETGTDTGTDTSADLPGTPILSGSCSAYPYTNWVTDTPSLPEVHLVGVYESQVGTPGPIGVSVTNTDEGILVLTSYSKVDWRVDLADGTNITSIVVSSYEGATVTFLSATTAPVTDVGWIGSCGYETPDDDPYSGCETPDLEAAVAALLGLPLNDFQGCYAAGGFSVD